MKFFRYAVPTLLVMLVASFPQAHAQGVSVNFGLGTATDGSNNACISTFEESSGPCFNTAEGFFGAPAPAMTGLFGTFGANFMFTPRFGVGGQYAFRWAQGPYGDVNYRPNFFDFNAIWHPLPGSKRIVPEIQGGIGGANLKFYFPSDCGSLGCSSSTFIQSANHFAFHAAAGVLFYIKGGFFVKPQFDIHYVPNLTQQFSSDWVPEYTVSIGYTLGSH